MKGNRGKRTGNTMTEEKEDTKGKAKGENKRKSEKCEKKDNTKEEED